MAKAVFLDRDGVMNELVHYPERGIIDSPFTVKQFKLCSGVAKAVKLLKKEGFKVIVVSNQPGVAKNYFTLDTLRAMDAKMKAELETQGTSVDGIYYCLHHPEAENVDYRMNCACRKPEAGLILQAARDFKLDLTRCYMVGDNLTDIKAGRNAGCKALLIGKMKCEMCRFMDDQGARPDAIMEDLLGAANTILEWEDSHGDIH